MVGESGGGGMSLSRSDIVAILSVRLLDLGRGVTCAGWAISGKTAVLFALLVFDDAFESGGILAGLVANDCVSGKGEVDCESGERGLREGASDDPGVGKSYSVQLRDDGEGVLAGREACDLDLDSSDLPSFDLVALFLRASACRRLLLTRSL